MCVISQGFIFVVVSLLASLLAGKSSEPIFTKFGDKVANGSRKIPLAFGGNPDHVTLELLLGQSYS